MSRNGLVRWKQPSQSATTQHAGTCDAPHGGSLHLVGIHPIHHGSGIRAEAHAAVSAEASSWIAFVEGAAGGGGGAFMRTGGARGAGMYGGCEGGGGAVGT